MCFVTALYWTRARLLHQPQETFLKHFLTTSYLSYHSKLSLTKITKWIKKPIKAALVSVLTSVSESDQTNEAEAELLHCFRTSESDQTNEAEAELLHRTSFKRLLVNSGYISQLQLK